jgi:hypothetical protein
MLGSALSMMMVTSARGSNDLTTLEFLDTLFLLVFRYSCPGNGVFDFKSELVCETYEPLQYDSVLSVHPAPTHRVSSPKSPSLLNAPHWQQ